MRVLREVLTGLEVAGIKCPQFQTSSICDLLTYSAEHERHVIKMNGGEQPRFIQQIVPHIENDFARLVFSLSQAYDLYAQKR